MPTPPLPPVRSRATRWFPTALAGVAVVVLLAAASADVLLYVGPTRPARYAGKRVAVGRDFHVTYTYAAGGRIASDTDRVSESYYFAAHADTPLWVRTFGFGTTRFARLAGTNSGAARWVAGRWALIAVGVGLFVVGRRRPPGTRFARRAGMNTPTPEPRQNEPAQSTGMGGAGDDNSGGGNASGTPDADTGMTAEDVINKGDVAEDRAKLFPNQSGRQQ